MDNIAVVHPRSLSAPETVQPPSPPTAAHKSDQDMISLVNFLSSKSRAHLPHQLTPMSSDSTVTMTATNPPMFTTLVPHLQPLSPVTITPTLSSNASEPLAFLSKIDRVEINHTTERDGVVYYVLDVFLEHSTSHIPTLKAVKTSPSGRPDYQLERRFTAFADLRYQVWAYAQRKHEEVCTCCKYCDAFMGYIVHSMSQPRLLVKLVTGVDTRKKLLTTFCNEIIDITLGGGSEPRPRNVDCDGFQAIPYLVQHFFQKEGE